MGKLTISDFVSGLLAFHSAYSQKQTLTCLFFQTSFDFICPAFEIHYVHPNTTEVNITTSN